jgi:hypothetical protein
MKNLAAMPAPDASNVGWYIFGFCMVMFILSSAAKSSLGPNYRSKLFKSGCSLMFIGICILVVLFYIASHG